MLLYVHVALRSGGDLLSVKEFVLCTTDATVLALCSGDDLLSVKEIVLHPMDTTVFVVTV